MKKKVAIIGHIDHGKTTLDAAIMTVLEKTEKEAKTIQEIIKEERSMKITANTIMEVTDLNFQSGREKRRERRAKERKSKGK